MSDGQLELFAGGFYGGNGDSGKSRRQVDYDVVYRRLREGAVTVAELQELTGVKGGGISQVITTMSLRFPVWSPRRGVYKLLDGDEQTEEEFDDGD